MRIRTIKPEFFTHEGLFDLEKESRLPVRIAFAGLWCAADREGRFKWEPRRLGVLVLPYDNLDFEKVLTALERAGFIMRYEVGEKSYGCIPSFPKHQAINTRESQSSLPSPADATAPSEPRRVVSANIPQGLRDEVFAAKGSKCVRCDSDEDVTLDHILPRSQGGTHCFGNLRPFCRKCNSARPVQGDGLIADLARDGFTIEQLRVTCMHVHAQAEGKGRERKGKGKEGDAPAALPEVLDFPDFREAWTAFLEHRRQKKRPMTGMAAEMQIRALAEMGKDRAIAAILHSIKNGWQGIFEPSHSPTKGSPHRGEYPENIPLLDLSPEINPQIQ